MSAELNPTREKQGPVFGSGLSAGEFAERVRLNQRKLRSDLKLQYDVIVCGSGSSGSVVARRLAENPNVSVLLLEAGGGDDVPSIMDADKWPLNLGSERDWNFQSQPDSRLNGRSIPLNMGKVLGGGSSINLMAWARGHQSDWDFFAKEAADPAWSYASVLQIYRRIEDWHGAPDPKYRGTGGPVFVEPAPTSNPIAPAMLEGARSVGIPTFENQNGRMMEGEGGASIIDVRARAGKRQSVFRSYTFPYMDRPNLTVLTHALVTRLIFEGKRATGVEMFYDGKTHRVGAGLEVVLSLGAIQTPKVLMQSGIGDQDELQRLGIPVVEHLPGVGQNFQDHPGHGCIWEYQEPLPPRNTLPEVTFFWKSFSGRESPDLQTCQGEVPLSSAENAARFGLPVSGWTLFGGVVRPKSRGRIRLTGPHPLDPVQIEANFLSHPDDLKAAIACVELCREIGNSAALRPFARREVMPGNLKGAALERFVRDAAITYWHQTCTAKMGRDAMSVVDGHLNVYGVTNLRVADGSIMPRVTTGNTQAPCVIIGEQAAGIVRTQYRL
ncbi:GMC family oxidoreductase [Ktedonobacter racemifer]|uniref:Glucose-methanol-choline oxidoreductase n=1 Tax=Ktedonobacter racemifer DSM 44963 TaxID=485913 RepID=D6U329_KTERA|nr:GMC family oxidoreductase N-terminal domain-containing protein [Ktedonobacter racemifer]EFH82934.1 glucose-methanol-choline oxidoreductase [Ktedonobacter racemifer DSM 44963]